MAETLKAKIKITIDATYESTVDIGNNPKYQLLYDYEKNLTDGTGNDQVSMLWSDERTLSASTSEDLELYGGLTDVFGTSFDLATIKLIIIQADADNGSTLTIGASGGGAPFNDWVGASNDVVKLKAGGVFFLFAPGTGYTVTDATADDLNITNDDGADPATYKVIFMGTV